MILGLVGWMQPVHGYDVRRELESWRAEEWANIQPGSIYHALRKLSQEGLLEEVGTEQVGSRPARTSYRMTAKGRAEFEDLLRRYWWEYRGPTDPFLAAFSFLPALPRREAAAALTHRARVLKAAVEGLRSSIDSEWMRRTKPAFVAWQFELTLARLEAEITWCERVAARVEAGEPYLSADFVPEEHWSEGPWGTDGGADPPGRPGGVDQPGRPGGPNSTDRSDATEGSASA